MTAQTVQPYTIGQRVVGTVEKIYPYGVFVRLDEQTLAYIRRRELAPASDQEPATVVQVGQAIEAIVRDLPQTGRVLELSHKALLPDPWVTFLRQFHEGAIVTGCIKDVKPYGVFVEILPGVDGFVPAAALSAGPCDKVQDLFWIGDQIEATISRIERRSRKVELSIQRRRENLATVAKIVERLNQHTDDETSVQKGTTQPPMEEEALAATNAQSATIDPVCYPQVGRILVVEDSVAICEPLVAWFGQRGYVADAARTTTVAHTLLHQHRYGLLLVDIDLPEMNGLVFIRQVQPMLNGTHLAVMSSLENLAEHASEIEALHVIETFVKPLDLAEIDHCLRKIGRGESLPFWQATAIAPWQTENRPFSAFTATNDRGASLAERLQTAVKQVVIDVGAETGAIFYQDAISQAISMLAWVGQTPADPDAIYALKESPVKDLLRTGDLILESRVSQAAESRFRKLLALLPFDSCIGVPIALGSATNHALFLFHRRSNVFHRADLRAATATATLCAALLERTSFEQRVQSLNKLLLSGQLAASFGHEVFNKLSGLEIQLHNLQTDLVHLAPQPSAPAEQERFHAVKQNVDEVVGTARDLRLLVETLQRLMRAEEEVTVDVGDAVHSVITQLRPLAYKQGVQIKATLAPALPLAQGSSSRLQQVLFNLMLNAIQHMATTPLGTKMVQVTVACAGAEATRPLKVRVTDSGAGIHKQLWEKIFDLGFTTRTGGSGLGLFIARSLVESMNGTIGVERSIVPLGTTFLVELPLATTVEEEP